MLKKLESILNKEVFKIVDTKEYSMTMKDKIEEATYGENPDDSSRYYGIMIDDLNLDNPRGFEVIFSNVKFGKENIIDKPIPFGKKKEEVLINSGTLIIKYGGRNIFESNNENSNMDILDLILKKEKELADIQLDIFKEEFLAL